MAAQDHDQDTTGARLRPNRNDPLHDQQLLSDVQAVNEQTQRALGPMLQGGLPVQPIRKPQVPRPAVRSEALPAGQLKTDDGG